MAEIIKKRETIETIEYELIGVEPSGAGWWFPAFENGEADLNSMSDGQRENYLRIKKEGITKLYLSKRKYSYKEPAVLKCDCGTEFPLEDQYCGACECPNCGRWFNLFGQPVNDPEEWEGLDYDF